MGILLSKQELLESRDINSIIEMLLDLPSSKRGQILRWAVMDGLYEDYFLEEYKGDIDNFIRGIDLNELGIESEANVRNELYNAKRVGRMPALLAEVLQIVVRAMPLREIEQIAKSWLYEEWFLDNSNGNIEEFVKSLDENFWGLQCH